MIYPPELHVLMSHPGIAADWCYDNDMTLVEAWLRAESVLPPLLADEPLDWYGSGDGDGYGPASGAGDGEGEGFGCGDWVGAGDVNGDGEGCGHGRASGYGDGDGVGYSGGAAAGYGATACYEVEPPVIYTAERSGVL